MAKAFRQAPLIHVDDGEGLPIQRQRERKAGELLGRMAALFDDKFILSVAIEIGLDEAITYSPDGEALEYDLTSLQVVALSSALAACAELRDGRV